MNEVTISELCKRYKKSKSYFTTILCRTEFNQFMVSNSVKRRTKFVFMDSLEFRSRLVYHINRKYN